MRITPATTLLLALLVSIQSRAEPAVFNRTTILDGQDKTPLTPSEKLAIISAARETLASIYVNTNVAANIHKASPFTQLSDLAASPPSPNHVFHAALRNVFQSLKDFHTTYLLPPPLSSVVATLPLAIRTFHTDPPQRRYVVSRVVRPELLAANPNFKPGVELVSYDGLPVDEAVINLGNNTYAANLAAALAAGEHLLTARLISRDALPQSDVVQIGFRTPDGAVENVLAPWLYVDIRDPAALTLLTRQVLPGPHHLGGKTPQLESLNAAPLDTPTLDSGTIRVPAPDRSPIQVAPDFQSLFAAEVVTTTSGPIGRLILPSFDAPVSVPLVAELSRILSLMPPNGLVIDIRSNSGGRPDYVKALVELFSDIPIPPQPFFVRSTELQERMLDLTQGIPSDDERRFINTLQWPVHTCRIAGEEYTGPIIDLFSAALPAPFPRVKRAYFGPVITLVDGLTYSSADLFAALQVDQGHSLLVGVSDSTGAGAATTKRYLDFVRLYPHIFEPLPQDVDFTTAFARFYRSGKWSGTMLQAFGVKPDIRYYRTYEDVMNKDCDMFEFLAEKLVSNAT